MVATILMNWENAPSRKLKNMVETLDFSVFPLFLCVLYCRH